MRNGIKIKKGDSVALKKLGVSSWPIWEKEVSTFDWSYSEDETCYILEGKAKVRTDEGELAEFGAGDIVVFPKGLNCVWTITHPIKKHYKFG